MASYCSWCSWHVLKKDGHWRRGFRAVADDAVAVAVAVAVVDVVAVGRAVATLAGDVAASAVVEDGRADAWVSPA